MLFARNFHNVQIASPPEITHNYLTTGPQSQNDCTNTHGLNFQVLIAVSSATKCRIFFAATAWLLCWQSTCHNKTRNRRYWNNRNSPFAFRDSALSSPQSSDIVSALFRWRRSRQLYPVGIDKSTAFWQQKTTMCFHHSLHPLVPTAQTTGCRRHCVIYSNRAACSMRAEYGISETYQHWRLGRRLEKKIQSKIL